MTGEKGVELTMEPKIFVPSDKKQKKAVVQYELLVPEDMNDCDIMYMMQLVPVHKHQIGLKLISRRVVEVKDYEECE